MQYNITYRKKDKGIQFIISYKDNERKWRQKSKQGFQSSKEAKSAAQSEVRDLEKSLKLKASLNTEYEGITFGQFAEKYIEHMNLYRETNSILAFKTVLNHFARLNNIELAKVSLLDIQPIVDGLTHTGLNPNTINGYITKLSSVFISAQNTYNLITNLPTKNVNIKKSKDNLTTYKRALNKNESNKLLKEFKDSKYYLILLIALTCGLRLGEILGLTWDDIDTKKSILKVTKQWKRVTEKEYGFGTLKSKNSNREIPIPPKTNTVLKNITVKNMNTRLFNFKSTGSVSMCLNRLLRLGKYNITIHELRHTYATKLIANGIDFKTAAKFLGHSVEQTMKTYSHVNDDMIKRATNIIDNIF